MLRSIFPLIAVLCIVVGGLLMVRNVLERRYANTQGGSFRIQVVMLALSLAGLLAVITVLPVSDTLRGQLLSLVGIVLSASIALSSTTFLGNAMAGVLLRVVGGFRIGDFVRVEDHFGRVSERGLLHTEIQTEDRDLVTLPNLYLVSNPVRVVRTSGTIVSAQVSLGYDVPRTQIEEQLLQAITTAELEEPFVHIMELGDFSITYRASGLLTDVKRLLSARSRLRGAILDALHGAGIEIVSPSFMNTRAFDTGARFLPAGDTAGTGAAPPGDDEPEAVVFDKAEEAEARDEIEKQNESAKKDAATDADS